MTGFRLTTFSGKAPKIFARLLPEDMAQIATNVRWILEDWSLGKTMRLRQSRQLTRTLYLLGLIRSLSLMIQYGLEATKSWILYAHHYLKMPMSGYTFLALVALLAILA